MKYTIYQITNTINNKIYIGKHQTHNPEDNYFGSGKAIVNAIKKHGKESFTKEVLYIFDNEDEMNNKEKELITEEFVNRSDTYNLGVGGEGGPHFKGKKHSEETIAKIRKAAKAQKRTQFSEEARRKIGEATSKRQRGKNNHNYGKMWIYSDIEKENKIIKRTDNIPFGWKKVEKIFI